MPSVQHERNASSAELESATQCVTEVIDACKHGQLGTVPLCLQRCVTRKPAKSWYSISPRSTSRNASTVILGSPTTPRSRDHQSCCSSPDRGTTPVTRGRPRHNGSIRHSGWRRYGNTVNTLREGEVRAGRDKKRCDRGKQLVEVKTDPMAPQNGNVPDTLVTARQPRYASEVLLSRQPTTV